MAATIGDLAAPGSRWILALQGEFCDAQPHSRCRCNRRPHPALRATFSRLREKDEIGARKVLSGAGAEALKLAFLFAWRDADCPNRVIACPSPVARKKVPKGG
ncbi:hypothetical protein [Xanthomonas axonopodis]